jgi:hypothetical protein
MVDIIFLTIEYTATAPMNYRMCKLWECVIDIYTRIHFSTILLVSNIL